jgi:hypothetical protein
LYYYHGGGGKQAGGKSRPSGKEGGCPVLGGLAKHSNGDSDYAVDKNEAATIGTTSENVLTKPKQQLTFEVFCLMHSSVGTLVPAPFLRNRGGGVGVRRHVRSKASNATTPRGWQALSYNYNRSVIDKLINLSNLRVGMGREVTPCRSVPQRGISAVCLSFPPHPPKGPKDLESGPIIISSTFITSRDGTALRKKRGHWGWAMHRLDPITVSCLQL